MVRLLSPDDKAFKYDNTTNRDGEPIAGLSTIQPDVFDERDFYKAFKRVRHPRFVTETLIWDVPEKERGYLSKNHQATLEYLTDNKDPSESYSQTACRLYSTVSDKQLEILITHRAITPANDSPAHFAHEMYSILHSDVGWSPEVGLDANDVFDDLGAANLRLPNDMCLSNFYSHLVLAYRALAKNKMKSVVLNAVPIEAMHAAYRDVVSKYTALLGGLSSEQKAKLVIMNTSIPTREEDWHAQLKLIVLDRAILTPLTSVEGSRTTLEALTVYETELNNTIKVLTANAKLVADNVKENEKIRRKYDEKQTDLYTGVIEYLKDVHGIPNCHEIPPVPPPLRKRKSGEQGGTVPPGPERSDSPPPKKLRTEIPDGYAKSDYQAFHAPIQTNQSLANANAVKNDAYVTFSYIYYKKDVEDDLEGNFSRPQYYLDSDGEYRETWVLLTDRLVRYTDPNTGTSSSRGQIERNLPIIQYVCEILQHHYKDMMRNQQPGLKKVSAVDMNNDSNELVASKVIHACFADKDFFLPIAPIPQEGISVNDRVTQVLELKKRVIENLKKIKERKDVMRNVKYAADALIASEMNRSE